MMEQWLAERLLPILGFGIALMLLHSVLGLSAKIYRHITTPKRYWKGKKRKITVKRSY